MPDLFGEIMKDAAKGLPAEHRTERDDGYIKESSGVQYVADFDDWL